MVGPLGQLCAPGFGVFGRLFAVLLVTILGAVPLSLGTELPAQAAPVAGVASAESEDPLQVTLTRMTPSVMPAKGNVTMSGEITNVSSETWRNVRVYPRVSYSEITTAQELHAAAASDPRLAFGNRITDAGAFDDSVKALSPGVSASWTITVPVELLAERMILRDGVYQIGVHALATNDDGRSSTAVGRARTFIPLISPDHPRVPAALVVPVRRAVTEDPAGRITEEPAWAEELAPGGRLNNLAALKATTTTLPVTWLMDPAVVDGARRLARGNPPRTLAGGAAETTATIDPDLHPATDAAAEWLRIFTALGADRSMLALPYGDLDVASAHRNDPALYARARSLSEQIFTALSLRTTPAISPLGGLLPAEALGMFSNDETVLVSSDALTGGRDQFVAPRQSVDQQPVIAYEDAVGITGQGEQPSGVSVRQQLLAEASIRSLAGDTRGMVVNLPADFDPGVIAPEFFNGLSQSFVSWQPLSTVTAAGNTAPEPASLIYPKDELKREISAETIDPAKRLVDIGSLLASVLSENESIDTDLVKLGLLSTSYHQRNRQPAAREALGTATIWGRRQLDKITIEAPSFVILSSDSGAFAIKVRNQLDYPVAITIVASGGTEDVEIQAPSQITLGPDSTRTVTLNAHARSIGVHPVMLQVADSEGRAFGETERLNVRSNSVGKVIWVILGIGVGILILAIAVRWVRRLRPKVGQ